jgi:hypothetical protein
MKLPKRKIIVRALLVIIIAHETISISRNGCYGRGRGGQWTREKKKGKTNEKHTKEGGEEEEQEEEEEAILLPVLHDAPDACEFPPPSRIRCCVVVAATPSPWNDVPPPPTAFTTSAFPDDASVESMTSSSLLPILKESER